MYFISRSWHSLQKVNIALLFTVLYKMHFEKKISATIFDPDETGRYWMCNAMWKYCYDQLVLFCLSGEVSSFIYLILGLTLVKHE